MKRISKFLAALLVVALCLSTVGALADGKVRTTGSVRLRKGPGLDYSEITTIGSGVTLSYTKSATDDRGVAWYYVKYNGKHGWVSSRYAKKTSGSGSGSGSSSSASGKVKTTGSVNLRNGAGLDYRSLATIGAGVTLSYDRTSKDERGVTWYRVTYHGQRGWVSSRYAKKSGTGWDPGYDSGDRVRATGNNVKIRRGAGVYYSILGAINKGQTLTYLDAAKKDDDGVTWYKVSYKGDIGWICSIYAYIV